MSEEFKVPRFCIRGCGETVIATQLTDDEWHVLSKDHPDVIREKSWHTKCTKCGLQSFIGGFN